MKKRYIALMLSLAYPCLVAGQTLPVGVDSKQPVEITADNLKVLQKDQVAVFEGKVEAVQGTTHLNADKMTVYYHGNDDKEKKAELAKKAAEPAVSKILVEGHVFMANPRETASGHEGTYDVDAATVTLTGDVVLTRQQNVLRGNKLVYNMDNGKSELFGGTPGENNPTQPGKGGRVKGLFVPGDSKK
jgi:lipopolysaccharide export system protein LptA